MLRSAENFNHGNTGMKTEEATALWQQMFSLADRMRDIGSSDYKQLLVNMTFNQLRMIKIVYVLNREYPEGVTLKVLAESLSITPAAASEMVDALVRKGMLTREHNPQDRRAVAITLAPFSRKKFLECEQTFDRQTIDFLESLEENERAIFMSVMAKFHDFVFNHCGDQE